MSNKIKVIGTGLTGLVGSRVKELSGDVCDWKDLSRFSGVDITDKKSVTDAIEKSDFSVLVHFAAFTDLNEAEKQTGDKNGSCYQVNVVGTRNITSACAETGKHLIYISTDAVFDGEKKTPYLETDKPNPINWYGQTKWLGEQEVINSGCNFTIVRIAYPFRAKFEQKLDFVRKVVKKLANGEEVSMFSDTLFTPTFIDDIAQALKVIVGRRPRGVFHAVGSSILSPFLAAMTVTEVFGFNPKLIKLIPLSDYLVRSSRPYPRYAALSNKKLRRELGVTMREFSIALLEMERQIQ